MDIAAYEQARAEQYAKTAVWLATWSGMSVSLLMFFSIVLSQVSHGSGAFPLVLLTSLSSPILLILNLFALILGFMGRRTDAGKRAMRLVGLFWANLVVCAIVILFLAR